MNKRPSLKINAISNWISLFVHIAVGFFLTPFVIMYLEKTGYGIWTLVGSFIGYYGLLNLGVGSAITRYIARYAAQNDTKKLNETANTALVMFCITGILVVLISFVIAEPLARFFNVEPEHYDAFKHIVWILGIATGLSFPSGLFSAMIAAHERYIAINMINIIATLLRTGLTVVILWAGYGLAGVAYSTLAATVFSIVGFVILARSVVPQFRIHFGIANIATLRTLLVYGGFTTIIAIADILRLKIDSLVIGKMIGMAEVGVYAVAALLIQKMLSMITVGMGVLTPRFAALDGAQENEELKEIFLRSLTISSFLACGAGLTAIILGGPFILLWVGEEFKSAIPVLIILAVSYMFALSQTPGISLMYAMHKHRYYAAVTIIEAIANVLLSIILAKKYGIIGVALGTAIPMFIVKLFVHPVYVSRLINVSLIDYIKAVYVSFGVSFLMVCAYYGGKSLFGFVPEFISYYVLLIGIALLFLIYTGSNLIFSSYIRRLLFSVIWRFQSAMMQPAAKRSSDT